MNPVLIPPRRPRHEPLRFRPSSTIVSLLVATGAVLAGCAGEDGRPGAGATTSRATACATNGNGAFSESTFLLSMGSALGYFRAGIWEPYQSGQLEPTRPSRAALVGVGLAATQSSRDVENAADNIARDAVLCDALAAPLAELGELLASLGAATDSDKVFSDAVDPEALTAVAKAQALFNTVVEVSREHGMTITPTKPNLF